MKIYKHEGKGFYIGSCVIVTADSFDHARVLIENELFRMGLPEEKPNINIVDVEVRDGLIYSHNGDY